MGRTVVAEDNVEEYISSIYGARKWQIGLVIGQVSSQRDYVVHLARTPEQSENAGKNGDTAEEIDDGWVVEHAHQVSRMLIGGVDVIGIFAFGPPDMLNKVQPKLRHLIFAIHKAVFRKPAAYFDAQDQNNSRIILQICSQTKKITCRSLDASDPKSTVSPAEFKFQSFISRWHKLEASVNLNVYINVPQKIERASLQTQITSGLQSSLQGIAFSMCTVNDQFRQEDQLLVPQTTEKRQGKSSSGVSRNVPVHKIDIYIQQGNSSVKAAQTTSAASLSLCGAIHSKACVNQKATVKEAIQAVKYDVVRSVLSRCQVLCDDVLDSQAERHDEDISSTWTLPKRVFAPLNDGPLSVCDYVFQDETIQDSMDRLSELLDVSPKESDLESPETFPDESTVQSIVEQFESEMKLESTRTSGVSAEDRQGSGSRKRLIGAVIGVLTAVIAAGVSFAWGE